MGAVLKDPFRVQSIQVGKTPLQGLYQGTGVHVVPEGGIEEADPGQGLARAAHGLAGRFDSDSTWVRLLVLVAGTLVLRAAQLGALGWEAGFPPAARALQFVLVSAAMTAPLGFVAFQIFDRIRGRGAPPAAVDSGRLAALRGD